ncbi:hypothetical protein H4R34_000568 [Dimargaris verticillata]|uniref:Uncharacterized protein n=1 Tax=Dimargaris verticillata TaxID=2761393 RepID=A0A9W8EB62_9FUNG|nr:hypothetical protein H4R34_000568 [Dimargaris verticillata]
MVSKFATRSSSVSTTSSDTFVEAKNTTLTKPTATTTTTDSDMEADFQELQTQLQRPGLCDYANQKVLLSDKQRSRMDLAKLVTTVNRMSRGRLVKQQAEYSPEERRNRDMLSLFDRMDRFNVPQLSDRQRFVRKVQPVVKV